jgi:hypothetical protein
LEIAKNVQWADFNLQLVKVAVLAVLQGIMRVWLPKSPVKAAYLKLSQFVHLEPIAGHTAATAVCVPLANTPLQQACAICAQEGITRM